MSVRFTLVDRQLKLLKCGLQSLQKIGSELLLEALPARVVLRTINSSLSAYLSITYNAAFFDSYHVLDCNVVQAGLMLKHILAAFRSQKVEKVLFDLNTARARATVTLHCENGLVKTYKLPTLASEILQASVDKQQFAVRLTAEAAAMSRLLSSFHSGLEEVTLVALPDGTDRPVHINSFIDPQKGAVDKALYTSVQVDPAETFLSYVNSADEPADVTINLKDFKAVLGLCEALGAHLKLCFDSPGSPLVAEPLFPHAHGQDVDFEAELILSTLLESHAGRAVDAAAAAQRAAAAAAGAAAAAHTPGGGVDSPGGGGIPSVLPGRTSGRTAHLGLSPAAAGTVGRNSFPGAVARPASGAAGHTRFAAEAHQQGPPPQQQQQQQQQGAQPGGGQPRGELSGLAEDRSLWQTASHTTAAQQQQTTAAAQQPYQQQQQQQRSEANPLAGDAGPLPERSWGEEEEEEEEAIVPASPPADPPPCSALPPGTLL